MKWKDKVEDYLYKSATDINPADGFKQMGESGGRIPRKFYSWKATGQNPVDMNPVDSRESVGRFLWFSEIQQKSLEESGRQIRWKEERIRWTDSTKEQFFQQRQSEDLRGVTISPP